MIQTTYTCDRCGEIRENIDLKTVSIVIGHGAGRSRFVSGSGDLSMKSVDWCCRCLEELGILPVPPKPKEGEPEPKIATLEEIVREIVREEISSA